jgi:hypothetical protein
MSHSARALVLAALGIGACQALAGIDEKELDPAFGKGDASADAPIEAGPSAAFQPVPPARPPGPATPSGNDNTR